jgi:hypothetical protein
MDERALGDSAPFMAADLGSFFGGGLSSHWIRRGWSVGKSRRGGGHLRARHAAANSGRVQLALLGAGGPIRLRHVLLRGLLHDLHFAAGRRVPIERSGHRQRNERHGRGLAHASFAYLIGRVSDCLSFQAIITVASLAPCLAALVMVALVRPGRQADPERHSAELLMACEVSRQVSTRHARVRAPRKVLVFDEGKL